ncbi:hypothetical protein PV08_03035 [Exophiala spinifera]|uniref:Carboxylesterase type B domain-containing protein n=1 Tax=Exophiala spinifera TaxID=91928 RepID=A0A0D1YU06_9EURO|nr:uncharacterized protein PV08_03035 [Exophiala spinifera]KIW18746.1 hypothetical protein PV08_03035 [Exophiala spinifera]
MGNLPELELVGLVQESKSKYINSPIDIQQQSTRPMASVTPVASKRLPYNGPTYVHAHPQLGNLTGRSISSSHFGRSSTPSTTVQFRSIPYATIPKRFAACRTLTEIPSDFDGRPHRDFTQFGAANPQLAGMRSTWFDSYGGPLQDDFDIDFDEFTCLTTTISVPQQHLIDLVEGNTQVRLPVMVYIHGGGAQEGVGAVDGLHSNAPLATYASSISMPVITVNIGYRLGWFGSMVCRDVLEEYSSDPNPSPHGPFNHCIQDQRAAFSWIHQFIGGFGGDESNVTAFGESAGGIFLVYHIAGSNEKLFNRAIIQSGTVLGHAPFELKELEYQGLLKTFNVTGSTPQERLEQIRQIPADQLIKYPGAHIFPFVDDIPDLHVRQPLFARGPVTYTSQTALIQSCEWLEELVIGDDFWEGHLMTDYVRSATAPAFVAVLLSTFPEPQAAKLLEAYDMPSTVDAAETADQNLFLRNLTLLVGDMMFSGMIQRLTTTLARDKSRKVYRYAFGLSNPFVGSNHSFVTGHHYVEILFIFLTLLDRYPRHRDNWLAKQACETAKRWITFAHGQAPWDEYTLEAGQDEMQGKIAICDDFKGWHVKTLEEDEEEGKTYPAGPRRYAAWQCYNEALEALLGPDMSEEECRRKMDSASLNVLMYLLSLTRKDETNIEGGERLTSALAEEP